MGVTPATDEAIEGVDESKQATILAAAIEEFSARGFSGTSMANIADAAGMSRPALYQYFRNKSDIFASAFTSLVEQSADMALEAFAAPGSAAERIDGLLQRFDGDLWEQMAASPHSEELLETASRLSLNAMAEIFDRYWSGVASVLAASGAGANTADPDASRAAWIEMLRLAPKGLKSDHPLVDDYRRRLTNLARTVAADIDAH